MRRLLPWLAFATTLSAACGPGVPPRYVLEHDQGSYRFRRYQKSIDAEVPLEGNPATAHLATYVEGGDALSVAPVTVTAYARAEGMAEAVRAVLRTMPGYAYGVEKHAGEWVWALKGEQSDDWLVWPSGAYLVKMGVPEGANAVPQVLLDAYLDQFPSALDSQGKARE